MYWAVWCIDAVVPPEVRKSHGKDHSAHLNGSPIPLIIAGPLVADGDSGSVGSLLVYEAETRAEVKAQVASDPFTKNGIWASTEIRAFKMSRNNTHPAAVS